MFTKLSAQWITRLLTPATSGNKKLIKKCNYKIPGSWGIHRAQCQFIRRTAIWSGIRSCVYSDPINWRRHTQTWAIDSWNMGKNVLSHLVRAIGSARVDLLVGSNMEKEATKEIANPDNTADKQQMEDIVQAKPSTFEVRLPHKEGTKTPLVERLFERR